MAMLLFVLLIVGSLTRLGAILRDNEMVADKVSWGIQFLSGVLMFAWLIYSMTIVFDDAGETCGLQSKTDRTNIE